jgi:hypothetical protein
MTPEEKLAQQLEDALADRRFTVPIFAYHIATSDPQFQKQFIQMAANALELIAINYDHGNFDETNYQHLRFASQVRDLVQSGEFGIDGKPYTGNV